MTITPQEALIVGGALVSITAWLYKVQGRVDVHDVKHQQHDLNHEAVREDLQYIRERIDEAITKQYRP
jgi:hypothetical protein